MDGADVNLGKHNGLAKRMSDLCPQLITVHAAAHVAQLCDSDALTNCVYWGEFRSVIMQIVTEYRQSGKKKHQLREMAKLLDGIDFVSLGSMHGIRWVASIHRLLCKFWAICSLPNLFLNIILKSGL